MKFQCGSCKTVLSCDDSGAGLSVICTECGKETAVPAEMFAAGTVIDDFVIREHIADGDIGRIYLAYRISTGEKCALKIISPEHTYDAKYVVRFIRDGRFAVKHKIRNTVDVYSVGEESGIFYYAMEYVEGVTLKEVISENGVMAERTMNTLLHVFEAYTELYRVAKLPEVKEKLMWIMDVFAEKVYNPELHRQEVFFDAHWNCILDLHSYGHDIETAWLIDRGVEVLGEKKYEEKMTPITKDLTAQIYKIAFDGRSLANECEKGVVNTSRIWWVQAESLIGFLNGWQKDPAKTEYLEAAKAQWNFIKEYVVDKRNGSEWFWWVEPDGTPIKKPIVEPWKCPYHNGRMCFEVIKRLS